MLVIINVMLGLIMVLGILNMVDIFVYGTFESRRGFVKNTILVLFTFSVIMLINFEYDRMEGNYKNLINKYNYQNRVEFLKEQSHIIKHLNKSELDSLDFKDSCQYDTPIYIQIIK
jgi:hypothetical protein